ncbi:hypothetical protein [Marinifilum fragile]|uniref:hypothetical protein n=1 Tax=Marinifilum fragile TaxID=570161 RepID=UPI002AAAA62F|nr:hypothetical protein [Marinifilum fragile]
MKIFLFTLYSVFLLIAFLGLTIFLWDSLESTIGKVLLISGNLFCIFYIFFILNSYVTIKLNKNIVVVSKLFSKRTYDLNDIEYWHDTLNTYRVRVRKLNLVFKNKKLKLVDTYDENVETLYHYLRIHYSEKDKMNIHM